MIIVSNLNRQVKSDIFDCQGALEKKDTAKAQELCEDIISA